MSVRCERTRILPKNERSCANDDDATCNFTNGSAWEGMNNNALKQGLHLWAYTDIVFVLICIVPYSFHMPALFKQLIDR